MNNISGKSLSILGGVVLICGGLYASREWWSPWTEVAPRTSVVADPAARIAGASGPDIPAASAPTAANRLVLRSRYELQGVMGGSGADATGLALIAVDGSLARIVRVGEAVGDGLVLLGLSPASAFLGLPGGPPVLVLAVGMPSTPTEPSQLVGQSAPAGSAIGSVPTIGTASPAPAVAYDASGAPIAGSVITQALPLVAADRVTVITTTPQEVPHPGRHQRLQSAKPTP